jgi:hypothetical protein
LWVESAVALWVLHCWPVCLLGGSSESAGARTSTAPASRHPLQPLQRVQGLMRHPSAGSSSRGLIRMAPSCCRKGIQAVLRTPLALSLLQQQQQRQVLNTGVTLMLTRHTSFMCTQSATVHLQLWQNGSRSMPAGMGQAL